MALVGFAFAVGFEVSVAEGFLGPVGIFEGFPAEVTGVGFGV